jgi:hypothetical protein
VRSRTEAAKFIWQPIVGLIRHFENVQGKTGFRRLSSRGLRLLIQAAFLPWRRRGCLVVPDFPKSPFALLFSSESCDASDKTPSCSAPSRSSRFPNPLPTSCAIRTDGRTRRRSSGASRLCGAFSAFSTVSHRQSSAVIFESVIASHVLAQPFEKRVSNLSFSRLRTVLDLSQELRFDPNALMRDPF